MLSNEDEKITVSGYPLCSFSIDAFRAWLAQNTGSLVSTAAPLVLEGIGGLLGGLAIGVGGAGLAGTALGAVEIKSLSKNIIVNTDSNVITLDFQWDTF
jgi:hypothetical protein